MKIKRFIGKKVRGYMDFDITFNDGLNFLIGVNGTGKTTILRLLRGLIMPQPEFLKIIDYQYINVEYYSDDDLDMNIDSEKNDKDLIIQKISADSEYHNYFKIGLNDSIVDAESLLKLFSNIKGVSFLELDRLNNFSETALKEVRAKIYDFIRNNVARKNKLDEQFRNSVLSLSKSGGDNLAEKLQQLNDEYSLKVSNLNAPITRFVDGANMFFSEGDKVLHIDDAGEISIEIRGSEKNATIFDLSSGEKQLIIMLGHLAFDNASVFVIDEPELSLHLSWQYKFAEALQTANPDAQFILATHASGIIAKKSNEKYCIDLTPRKK